MLTLSLARTSRRLAPLIFIGVFAFSSTFAQGVKKKVHFAKGTSKITIKESVVRGDQDRYYIGANAGQTMTVKITSTEDNAVFQIYRAGEKETLKGAGEEDDATNWSGELPANGQYVIVVGGTRGNATYALTISIE